MQCLSMTPRQVSDIAVAIQVAAGDPAPTYEACVDDKRLKIRRAAAEVAMPGNDVVGSRENIHASITVDIGRSD